MCHSYRRCPFPWKPQDAMVAGQHVQNLSFVVLGLLAHMFQYTRIDGHGNLGLGVVGSWHTEWILAIASGDIHRHRYTHDNI